MQEQESSNGWRSLDEAARHIGVHRGTLYHWSKTKGFPAYKVGWTWKCKLDDVDEWVRKRNVLKKVRKKKKVGPSSTASGANKPQQPERKSRLTWVLGAPTNDK